MSKKHLTLDPNNLPQGYDWYGNNVAFTCPRCGKVFVVSSFLNKNGRKCSSCGQSRGYCTGGPGRGQAFVEWEKVFKERGPL